MASIKTLAQRIQEGLLHRKEFYVLGENIVRVVKNRMEGSDVVSDVITLSTRKISTVSSASLHRNPNILKMKTQYPAFLEVLNTAFKELEASQKIEPVAPEIFAVPTPGRTLFYRITGAPDADDNLPVEYLPEMDFFLRPEPEEEVMTKAPIKSVYLLLLATPETIRETCQTDMETKNTAPKQDKTIWEVHAPTNPKEKEKETAQAGTSASSATISTIPLTTSSATLNF